MATEFESTGNTISETDAFRVREVARILEAAMRAKYNVWKEQIEAGEDEASYETHRAFIALRQELRTLKENYPQLSWTTLPDEDAVATIKEDILNRRSRILPGAIVLSALIIAGAILFSVVLLTGANWYYAEMIFILAAYLVWQHWL